MLTPVTGATIQTGVNTTITWRAFGFTGTVDLAYSPDGTTFTSIATGVANSGSYTWAVPAGLTPGSTYVLKITAESAAVSGLSQTFSVSGKITKYYINANNSGTEYTTAPGSDANNGLSPATPKATLQGLLAAYALGAGDIVYVDSGTYAVTTNIALTAANSGTSAAAPFTIIGPTAGYAPAILNRGNLNAGQDVFNIQTVSYVTLQNLTITGANIGIEIGGKSAGIQLLNDTVTGNGDIGIEVDLNSGGTATAVTGLLIQSDVISGNGLDRPMAPTTAATSTACWCTRATAGSSSSTTPYSATTPPACISRAATTSSARPPSTAVPTTCRPAPTAIPASASTTTSAA